MPRVYYSKSTKLNTTIRWEGRTRDGAYEVPKMKSKLLQICVMGHYTEDELEEGVYIRLGKKDRIMREKRVMLPIKPEQLRYIGGDAEDPYMPTPIEAFVIAAVTKMRTKRNPETSEITQEPITGSTKKPHKKDKVVLTNLKAILYEDVKAGTLYSIDADKVLAGYKDRIDKLEAGDVISSSDAASKLDIKVIGSKVGKKRKKAVAV